MAFMAAVPGSRNDGQIREMPGNCLRGPDRCLDVVDRQHEKPGMFCAGRTQEVQFRRIAVVHDVPALADHIDLGCVNLERGKRPANDRQQAADNLAEAAESGDERS